MRNERGAASVELALVTPVLVLLMLFAVAGGRLASSRAGVDAAARDAARAASIARTATAAERDGLAAAEATLADGRLSCRQLDVTIDTVDFRAGGTVAAGVTCEVDLADLTGLGLPARRTVSSRFVEPVDLFRGVSP
ncbi:MAG: TadE family protein [Nocardioidaceae bacterium]